MIHPEEYVPVMITSTHPDLLTNESNMPLTMQVHYNNKSSDL